MTPTSTAAAVTRLLGRPDHPPCWWCPTCGQLEAAGCHHPRGGPSGPPPLPRGRVWAAARRRRHALTALTRITTPRTLP